MVPVAGTPEGAETEYGWYLLENGLIEDPNGETTPPDGENPEGETNAEDTNNETTPPEEVLPEGGTDAEDTNGGTDDEQPGGENPEGA